MENVSDQAEPIGQGERRQRLRARTPRPIESRADLARRHGAGAYRPILRQTGGVIEGPKGAAIDLEPPSQYPAKPHQETRHRQNHSSRGIPVSETRSRRPRQTACRLPIRLEYALKSLIGLWLPFREATEYASSHL